MHYYIVSIIKYLRRRIVPGRALVCTFCLPCNCPQRNAAATLGDKNVTRIHLFKKTKGIRRFVQTPLVSRQTFWRQCRQVASCTLHEGVNDSNNYAPIVFVPSSISVFFYQLKKECRKGYSGRSGENDCSSRCYARTSRVSSQLRCAISAAASLTVYHGFPSHFPRWIQEINFASESYRFNMHVIDCARFTAIKNFNYINIWGAPIVIFS